MYLGRQPGEDIQKNLGENIVHQLCSGFRHTGRNINTDNVFTSVPLAEHLLEKGLTIVGTLRQNKPDTPPVMKASRSREVHGTEYGFNGSVTMISYGRKKGTAVLLLSTMHHSEMEDENSPKQKPEAVLFYNQTKGGVDTMDQMVGNYICKCQTQRWPTVLWYNMIDVACDTSHEQSTGRYPNPTNLHH